MTKILTIFYQNTRMIYLVGKKTRSFRQSFKLKREGNPKSLKTKPDRFIRFL